LNGGGDTPPVYLSYLGTGDPRHYGIRARRLPGFMDLGARLYAGPLGGGVYCISATTLQHVYSPLMGPWAASYEQLYREALADPEIAARMQATQPSPDRTGRPGLDDRWDLFLRMRFARLCAALRQREPDAMVGYSILIYRLTDRQVRDALYGPPDELVPAIQVRGYPMD
jgi:hypothetical protein